MEFTTYYIRRVNRESVGERVYHCVIYHFINAGRISGVKQPESIYIYRYIYRNTVLKQNQEKEGRKKCWEEQ